MRIEIPRKARFEMLSRCYSGAITGVEATPVEIEVNAFPVEEARFTIVGLPDIAVRESKDRVRNAIIHSGYKPKNNLCVTVNLAPADVRKEGPIYDLPIAIGLLRASKRLECQNLDDFAFVGELALSGQIRRVKGALPIAIAMQKIGKKTILVPKENAEEASIASGINVIPVSSLAEAAAFLTGEKQIAPVFTDLAAMVEADLEKGDDFADVKGQEMVKRAIEVAVAGGHNMLMIGSPGSGKTMIARRVPSILPPMSVEEALEVSKIHSVVGASKGSSAFVTQRPFRAPHHTVSSFGLLGGGSHPKPGEVSLAHRGVLFLDEFAEFPRPALEVLRQPLEDGHVAVSRASAALDFPSRFMLVAAMNPCPCGYYNDPTKDCTCSRMQIMHYQQRISGPLLDRIDIQVGVNPVGARELHSLQRGESSAAIRTRVLAAREIQKRRFRDMPGVLTNSEVKSRDLKDVCKLTASGNEEVQRTIDALKLSARAYDRILRVARTIADLAGREQVERTDVFEAATYRRLDQSGDSFWI